VFMFTTTKKEGMNSSAFLFLGGVFWLFASKLNIFMFFFYFFSSSSSW
jgi:hypothetical protein